MYPGGSVPLGEVLARQAVGVLVGAALPGAVGVAEVHLHAGRGGHACMQGGFGSLVPCRAVAQQRGQRPHLADDGVLHVFGVVPVGQVQEDREPGGAFHEGSDRAAVAGTADQVAFPVAGDRPVGDLGRPLIMTMGSRNLGRLDWPSPRCLRTTRPRLMACLSWSRSSPLPCAWMAW